MGDVTPFDFFRQETCHPSAIVRTDAMRKVAVIAAMMGPDKARSEMLAYLHTKLTDMDQVLLAMAQKLGLLLPLIGGPGQAQAFVPLFEGLCDAEEVAVRDAAVVSINKILKQLGPSHKTAVSAYFEMFKRLSNEENGENFYGRVSCCHYIPELYRLLGDADRIMLREAYTRLCKDELPIVRRAAVYQFASLLELLDVTALSQEFVALLHTLLSDESQTVTVVAVEALSPFSILLKKHQKTEVLTTEFLPLIKTYSESPSWRMRLALSKKFGAFASSFLPAEVSAEIYACLINLIQDPEPEVRSVAILEVLPFLDVVGSAQFIAEIAPAAAHLADDPMQNVRKLLAELCVDVAAKVGPEAVAMHLSDLIIRLMEDEDPMVRLRILKKLPIIAEESPALCARMTENLKALFTNTNWRVRQELLVAMPALVKHMGQDYFMSHFQSLVLSLLKDDVAEVRTASAAAIPNVAAVANVQWVYEELFPEVRTMTKGPYLIRLAMISALEGLLALEQLSEQFHQEVSQLLLTLAADKVPNIRIRAIQALTKVVKLPHLSSLKSTLQPMVASLSSDKDNDVKYFANAPH